MQHGNTSDEMDAGADTGADSDAAGADAADLAADYERGENVASIERAPRHILPHGPARAHLLQLARTGQDVQVYQAASLNGSGVWNVWLIDRRVPLADYVARYEGRDMAAQLADTGADIGAQREVPAPSLMARQRELQARATAGGAVCQDDYEWATGTGAYAADTGAPDLPAVPGTPDKPDERGR